MAAVSIYSRSRVLKFGSIEIDVSVRETHGFEADVTDVPIESGSVVSDHRRVRLPTLSVEGIVGSAPLTTATRIDDEGAVVVRDLTREATASEDFDELYALFQGDAVFEVVTGLRSYPSMHFTRLSVTRDKGTGTVIAFSADLRRLEFVTAELVKIQPLAADKPKAPPKTDKGKQETKETKKDSGRYKSLALKMKNGIKNFFSDDAKGETLSGAVTGP